MEISFLIDEKATKRKFYKLSKQFHPDFYTLESEEKQAEILEFNTQVIISPVTNVLVV